MSAILQPTAKAGNTLWVDKVNGLDATGERGRSDRPYLTLAAAKTAASSGDTVIVLPGAYTAAASLAKNGVNWHFFAGAVVTMASDDASTGIWDDGGAAMTFVVSGRGSFTRTATSASENGLSCIHVAHASSIVEIECLDITVDPGGGNEAGFHLAIHHEAGRLRVVCRDITVSNISDTEGSAAIFWINGPLSVHGRKIQTAQSAVWSFVQATPTGDAHIGFDEIVASGQYGVWDSSTESTAAIWVRANTLKASASWVINQDAAGVGRVYVEAQKLFGTIYTGGGLLYVRADKIATNDVNGATLGTNAGSGTSYIQINHWDTAGIVGQTVTIAQGTHNFIGGNFTVGSGTNGIAVNGGTLRARGMRIDSNANNASNPITKSGGTLIIDHCTLVAEATRDSISAPTAQNVVAYGCYANKAVDADVTITITGGLTVDADVV